MKCGISSAHSLIKQLWYDKSRKNPRWMNQVAKSALNDLIVYKIAQNKAATEYRNAKRQFEKKLAKVIKNNPKRFYAYVRSNT